MKKEKVAIDLSKIPVKKTATDKIKANFDGTEKEYEIRALNDGEQTNLLSLLASSKDVFRNRNLYVLLLSCGLEIEQEVADLLYCNCNKEAMRVGDAIFTLSKMFEDAKASTAKDAEKNSVKPPEA